MDRVQFRGREGGGEERGNLLTKPSCGSLREDISSETRPENSVGKERRVEEGEALPRIQVKERECNAMVDVSK